MATQQQLEQWLQEGIVAAKAGRLEQARFRLLDVVEQDQANEVAWYWLYQVFNHLDDKRICLENLLTINPRNQWARDELRRLMATAQSPPRRPAPTPKAKARQRPKETSAVASLADDTTRPLTLKLVTAFWLGISLILLGGGVVASAEWLASGLQTRSFPTYITAYQAFEFLVAMMFILLGILGLTVAALLLSRSLAGFYGSIILGLLLLLIGPTISLITQPPNYLTMICTGGISGMIVLLTLASQAGLTAGEAQNEKKQ